MTPLWKRAGVVAIIAVVIACGVFARTRYVAAEKATKEELAREILGARGSFGDLGYFKSQSDPESQRVAKLIESRRTQVEEIVKQYEAGTKTPKQALAEIRAVFVPNSTTN